MKTYEEYKSSEIEWIGEIPTDWDVKKIKWMTSIKRGASPRPIDDPKYFDEDGEYAWVRIADVSNAGMYLEQTTQKMSELGASLSVKREPGDIFVSIAGTVGKPCITNIKCCIHDGFVYFPDYKGDKKYFYYIFESGAPYKGLGKMGTQLNLNTETIGSIKIPDIPSSLQTKIGLFIDGKVHEIDTLLDLKQKQIEKLEQQRQSIITEAVTKGLNPNVKMKDSGVEWIGEIPGHWNLVQLTHVSRITRLAGYEYTEHWEPNEEGEILALRGQNIGVNEIKILGNEERITEALSQRLGRSRLYSGNVVFPCVGSIGKSACIYEDDKYHINQNIAKLTPSDNLDSEYLTYYLNSELTKYQIRWYNTSEMQPSVLVGNLRKFKITLPPIDEQGEIIKSLKIHLLEINDLMGKIQKQINSLKEYRQSLIYEAVTGKIDVNDMELD